MNNNVQSRNASRAMPANFLNGYTSRQPAASAIALPSNPRWIAGYGRHIASRDGMVKPLCARVFVSELASSSRKPRSRCLSIRAGCDRNEDIRLFDRGARIALYPRVIALM